MLVSRLIKVSSCRTVLDSVVCAVCLCSCLQVDLLDAPSAVVEAWQGLEYPHITLWVAPGHAAAEAMTLGREVEAGKAERSRLKQPLVIKGVVKGFL